MSKHILFIHGALHGGWCWQPLVDILQQQGSDWILHTPTLIGLAERQLDLTQAINLSAHIEDMSYYIDSLTTSKITIVAHSYGALIALALNERYKTIIEQVILIDGLVCDKGQQAIGVWPEFQQQQRLQECVNVNDVVCLNTAPAAAFGISDPLMRHRVESKLTPHPLACYLEPLPLELPLTAQENVSYIQCTSPVTVTAQQSLTLIRSKLDWHIVDIESGHDVMLIDPQKLAETLVSLLVK